MFLYPTHLDLHKMAKEPILHFKASRAFIVWLLILLATFISAMLVLLTLGTDYAPNQNKSLITSLLLFAISAALFWSLKQGDKKLLMWSGTLEFIILLLPLLSFNARPDYLPYELPAMFIVVFPVLWVMLPIGFFYLQEKQEERAKLWKSLVLLAVVVGVLWVAFRPFGYSYYAWDSLTQSETIVYASNWDVLVFMWSMLFLLPLAVWAYVERSLSVGKRKKSGGLVGFVEKNLAEVLLVVVIIILIAVGYLMNHPYDYSYYMCGDGICDQEEVGWCPEDCGGSCGDGICSYDEEYYGSCPEDCG